MTLKTFNLAAAGVIAVCLTLPGAFAATSSSMSSSNAMSSANAMGTKAETGCPKPAANAMSGSQMSGQQMSGGMANNTMSTGNSMAGGNAMASSPAGTHTKVHCKSHATGQMNNTNAMSGGMTH